jgi:hypothetical protein
MFISILPDERPHVTLIGCLKMLIVKVAMLLNDDDGRVASLHQQQVHQQTGCASIAVYKRVDVYQFVVC